MSDYSPPDRALKRIECEMYHLIHEGYICERIEDYVVKAEYMDLVFYFFFSEDYSFRPPVIIYQVGNDLLNYELDDDEKSPAMTIEKYMISIFAQLNAVYTKIKL
jgi:hypothetical protein